MENGAIDNRALRREGGGPPEGGEEGEKVDVNIS